MCVKINSEFLSMQNVSVRAGFDFKIKLVFKNVPNSLFCFVCGLFCLFCFQQPRCILHLMTSIIANKVIDQGVTINIIFFENIMIYFERKK